MRTFRRLAQWWRLRAYSEDLSEELSFHRDAIERDLIARGQSPADARIAARRAMGHETLMREESRGVWLWPRLEGLMQDARCTLRGLRKNPAFTIGVALTFALGVGANTAMFSIVDRLMFRPPVLMRDPASVNRVYLYKIMNGMEQRTGGQYARHSDLARWTTAFSDIAAFSEREVAVGVGQDARTLRIEIVSASFFGFFDAPPVAGRYFTVAEDSPPTPAPVAVLSYAMWRTQYGGRADAIGARLQIGSLVYSIIGVAPEGFVGLAPQRPPMVFVPASAVAASEGPPGWATTYTHAVGLMTIVRRKPGVSVEAATADLTNAFLRSYRNQADRNPRLDPIATVHPRAAAASILRDRGPERSNTARVAVWLGGVALIVLLIACANVANLLLARALSRRREIAMRIALGVSTARLFSQLLTESMTLALAGSVLGVFVATWMGAALSATLFPGTAATTVITDPRTLAFAGAVTLAAGLFTSVLPLLQVRRLSLTDDLRSGGRGATSRRSRARVTLLVMQGALSVVLLVGAGLFVRSVQHVRDVRIGFDADSVLIVELNMRDVSLDRARAIALRERLLAAATTVPGITHASLQLSTPFNGAWSLPLFVAGIDSTDRFGEFEFNGVSADYFATMGTRILEGRAIEPSDVAGATRVMVAGASMAAVLWPGQNAIGKCVRVEADTMPCTYVVGVAEDIHTRSIGPEGRYFYYYVPAAQVHPDEAGVFVRTPRDPRAFIEPLRKRLQEEMPGTSYVSVWRIAENIEDVTRSWIMGATLFTAFGALALVLAAVGLYSVIAYDIAQRRKELAVRVALGAATADVLQLVVFRGMRIGVAGIVLGGAIALGSGRWIAPLLFKQSPNDPAVFGVVAVALLAVTAMASLIPALRAARVDPRSVLQAD